ncbi:deoxynucleotide monophosphate kinase family protein [Alcaligenes sp. SDU_A2]|uniref:deoxynucleotide monophosphate kinase family protein n=1 Tax=Alcaligenes sp. SDU_A2 TaxID=3136634 RepID=UPI00311E514A
MIGLAARARSGKDTVAGMLLAQSPLLAAYALADPVKMACEVIFGLTQAQAWTDDTLKEKNIALWERSPRQCFQLLGTDWMRRRDPEHWLRRAQHLLQFGPGTPCSTANRSVWALALHPLYGMDPRSLDDGALAERIDPFWGLSPQQAQQHLRAQVLDSYPDYEQRRARLPIAAPSHTLPDMSQARCLLIKDIRYENEADFIRRHGGEIWHIERPGNPVISQHSSEWGVARQPEDRLILNNAGLHELAAQVARQWESFTERHTLY